MGFFDRFKEKKDIGDLSQELDEVKLEDEISGHRKEIEEKKAIIAQLKRDYGPSWKKRLGIDKLDLQTLRSFLKTANQGMRGEAGKTGTVKRSFTVNPELRDTAESTAVGTVSKSGYSGIHRA